MGLLDTLAGLKEDVEQAATKVGVSVDWNPTHSPVLQGIAEQPHAATQQNTPATSATVEPGTMADAQAKPATFPIWLGAAIAFGLVGLAFVAYKSMKRKGA